MVLLEVSCRPSRSEYNKMAKEPDVKASDSFLTVPGADAANLDDLDPNEDPDAPWDDLDDIPEPPDGGWGWVIVAASFLCNMIVDGISYTFGIFFMEFVNYYQSSKGKTAWVGSLLSGCYLSAGPLVSALTNRFGCRPVTITGSVVAGVAFLLSTIAPNVDILMLTYGIMGGIGFGLIYLPAIVSVGHYFSTKRAFATGIAVCGSGVGTFIFAPFCKSLLDTYDWKGALTILAGLALNCIVFGALMRPLEAGHRGSKPLLQRIAEEKARQRNVSLCHSQFFLVQHADGTVEKRPKSLINTEPGVHSTLYLDQFGKSPADTPIITLSPIEEVTRRSPSGSKGDSSDEREPLSPQPTTQPPTTNATSTDGNGAGETGALTNGQPGIREIARRKGIVTRPPGMKISLSNITVNSELQQRKNSATVQHSSSGFLCASRNNNYLVEEVWKKLHDDDDLPLDAAERVPVRRPSRKDYARPMYRKDIFYSGSIMNLPEYNSQKDVRSYVASVISIPRDATAPALTVDGRPTKPLPPCCPQLPKSMTDTMREVFNFKLLKEPVFLMICIANIFGMMGFYVPFVYITDSAVLKGIPMDQATFLISIIGITNTFGRLLFGWISDRPGVNALFVNNVCLTLSGICVVVLPFCNTYSSLVVICILFGLFVSAYICLTSIILVELLGLDKLTNAFGILSLFRGAASIVGPPTAGSILDLTGSYDLPFFISGGLIIFSAVLSFMVPLASRRVQKRPEPQGPIPHPQRIEEEDEEEDDDEPIEEEEAETVVADDEQPEVVVSKPEVAVEQIVSVV